MSRAAITTPTVEQQDLNSIREGEWPDREFPLGPREKPTRRQVIIKQSVLNEIHGHGRSAPDIEVCGVLVGNVYQDAMGPFVYIEAGIRGNFAAGRAKPHHRDAGGARPLHHRIGIVRRDDIAALVLAEPERMRGNTV